jgi:SAM-dependent methyltransferase
LDPRLDAADNRDWDFVVLDKWQTPVEEAVSWSVLAPLIGIDEGGPYRNSFEFLIDLLPAPQQHFSDSPNVSDPSLLPLPRNRRLSFQSAGRPLRVLVSFGLEDAAGLGASAVRALETMAADARPVITVVKTGSPIPNLREHLADYDLLITHFGLTAFEALHARVPVILASPTRLHEALARNAGFLSLGIGRAAASRIVRHISGGESLRSLGERCQTIAARHGLENPPGQSMGTILAGFTRPVSRNCLGCGAPFPRFRARGLTPGRFPDRSYLRCGHCGLIRQIRTGPPAIEYETDYFFSFYKEQYGKTYLEDFPGLVLAGKQRLAIMRRILGDGSGRLLDIGCAYGPFLSAAREDGFEPLGLDPAADAVRYVREELGIEARAGFFPELSEPLLPEGQGFRAITLWYVIEHFADLGSALREINRLLEINGILAFSTPSFSGISGRKSLRVFLENSPQDHWTIWSPARCGRLLARHGFRVLKIRVTGHHPERFPLGSRIRRGGLLWKLILLVSRVFRLGDTFECYAIKTRSL